MESNLPCSWSMIPFSSGMCNHIRLCPSEPLRCFGNPDDTDVTYPDSPTVMRQQLKGMVFHHFIGYFLCLWIATITVRWPSKIHGGPAHTTFLEYDRKTAVCNCGAGVDKINGAFVPLLFGRALRDSYCHGS